MTCTKAVPMNLYMKFISEFNHGSNDLGCLHCAVLKALQGFQEKESMKQENAVFPSKYSKCNFQDFENI